MKKEISRLQGLLETGKQVVIAEISPPSLTGPQASLTEGRLRSIAKSYSGMVDALGISDNRDHACLAAAAFSYIALSEGIEPILHMVTRDRNRIALLSDCCGARALGIKNILCTSGTHQALTDFKNVKNVFDIDSIQLLEAISAMDSGNAFLGAVASPFADPMELQIMRLEKKIAAGAKYLITQPIFDVERFSSWWKLVTERGIHEKVAIIAGIRILTGPNDAKEYAAKRPLPMVPDSLLKRVTDQKAGIKVADEIIGKLSSVKGLRGFEICGGGNDEAALAVLGKIKSK